MKNIILFDRQDITRLGMEALALKIYPRCTTTVVDAKAELVRALLDKPDSVVVIDYALADLSGVDALLNISARFPEAHWILFSEELSVQLVKKVLCHGAFSVLLKHAELAEITNAVALALDGKSFVCAQLKELLASSESKEAQGGKELLTATEVKILREIALGKSAKEIAAARSISMHTVATHRKNIYRKLEVNNSQEAAGYAVRAGIVSFGYSI